MASTLDAAWSSMAHQCTDGDEFDCKSIYKVHATHRYTHTSRAMAGRGFSLEQWMVWRRCSASKWTGGFKMDENLWAQLPSCIGMPQALGAWRRNS
jgi:hypothetical protein